MTIDRDDVRNTAITSSPTFSSSAGDSLIVEDIKKKNIIELPFMRRLLLKVFPGQQIADDIAFTRNILSNQANRLKTTQIIINENKAIFQEAADTLNKNLTEATTLSIEAQKINKSLLTGQSITGEQAVLLQKEMRRVLGGISELNSVVDLSNNIVGVRLGKLVDEFSSMILDQNTNADIQQKLFKDIIRIAERNGVSAEAVAKARAIDFATMDLNSEKDRILLKNQLEHLRDISQGIEITGQNLNAIKKTNKELVTNQEDFEEARNKKSLLSGRSVSDIASGGLKTSTEGIGGGLLTNALRASGFGSIAAMVESTGLGPSIIAAVAGGVSLLSKGISGSIGGLFSTVSKTLPKQAAASVKGADALAGAPKGFSMGKFAKLAAKGFLVLNVLTSISGFLEGFSNAGELLGKAQSDLTLFDKVFAGIAKFIDSFSFGLISAEDITSIDSSSIKEVFNNVVGFFKDIAMTLLPIVKDLGTDLFTGVSQVMSNLFGKEGVFTTMKNTLIEFTKTETFADMVGAIKIVGGILGKFVGGSIQNMFTGLGDILKVIFGQDGILVILSNTLKDIPKKGFMSSVIEGFSSIVKLLFGPDGIFNIDNLKIKLFDSVQNIVGEKAASFLFPDSFSSTVQKLKQERDIRLSGADNVVPISSASSVNSQSKEESARNAIKNRELQERAAAVATVLPAIVSIGRQAERTSEGTGSSGTLKPIDGDIGLATMVANLMDR